MPLDEIRRVTTPFEQVVDVDLLEANSFAGDHAFYALELPASFVEIGGELDVEYPLDD